jgi:hypothetical protein
MQGFYRKVKALFSVNLMVFSMLSVLVLMNISCKKDEDDNSSNSKGSNFTPTLSGNGSGDLNFKINGKDYNFKVYRIDITEENPSVLYRFLVSGESATQRVELYIYPNELGEYSCQTPNKFNGIFNFMLINKKDNSLELMYTSTFNCNLLISKLDNYQYEVRDTNYAVTFPGSLDLIEATFRGSSDGNTITEGKLSAKVK